MAVSHDPVISFIEALELADVGLVTLEEAPSISEAEPGAFVDAGSLVAFGPGVSAQHKADVLNSTLLAQLAANKKFNRETQTEEWYRFYQEVFGKVGWVLRGFEFTLYEASGAEFTADKVILEILKAIATGNDLAVVAATMEALNSLGNDSPTVKVFETNSHTASSGNFQISVAAENDGIVGMKLGAFYFMTTQTVTRVLWFRFQSSSTKFYKGNQVAALDEEVYAKVRQTVVEKLGDAAKKLVADLEI